jgi:hypothetical protein
MWTRRADGDWRHLHVTAFPDRRTGALLGAMSIFWEI